MDCHGAGGDWSFNSLIPDALDARCEFVVQTRWTEYTAMLETGCDAALFVGQHAPRRRRARRALAHRQLDQLARRCASTARPSARSASTPRCAGPGACPVALVTGDDVVCAEATDAARRRPAHAGGQDRASAASAPATSPPRAPASGSSRPPRDALAGRRERPGLRPRGALHDRRRARHARPRRRLPPPRRRDAHRPAHASRATAPTWWDAWRALYL